MAARNVNLTDHLSAFVDEQVESGRHQNASEVVREALRRYEHDMRADAERIAAIRGVIREGRADMRRGDYLTIEDAGDAAALLARLTGRSRDAA